MSVIIEDITVILVCLSVVYTEVCCHLLISCVSESSLTILDICLFTPHPTSRRCSHDKTRQWTANDKDDLVLSCQQTWEGSCWNGHTFIAKGVCRQLQLSEDNSSSGSENWSKFVQRNQALEVSACTVYPLYMNH